MIEHYIYKITNKKTNKYYVGRTSELQKRFDRHLRELRGNKHHCIYLQRVWNKYGEQNFEFSIVEFGLSEEEAIKKEQDYLDNKRNEIYNVSYASTGGDLLTNHPMKEQIIEKMTKSIRQRYENMTEEERKKIYGHQGKNNPMYGKKHSSEVIKKIKQKNEEYYQYHDGYRKDKTWEELFGEKKQKK